MSAADRPNTLVALTDDHAAWALGCYGDPVVVSPTMDLLAATKRYPGRSFAPLLFRPGPSAGRGPWRDAQFCEYGPARMVRTATHKLVRRHGSFGADQLFDLAADPDERRNVIAEPVNAAVVAELDERLAAYFDAYTEPGRSGLLAPDHVGAHNPSEPWNPKYAGYRCAGWPAL